MKSRILSGGFALGLLLAACHHESHAPASGAVPSAPIPAAAPASAVGVVPSGSARAVRTAEPAAPPPPVAAASSATEPRPSPSDIHYRVSRSPGTDGEDLVGVVAERGGRTFVVVPPTQGVCLSVSERDLDGDGLMDALIENTISCGGNLTPNDYSFVAGTRGERFEEQPLGTQWEAPEPVSWQGRWSLVIETDNEGINLDRPQLTTRRFVFEKGRVVIAEEKRAVEQKALDNLRSEQFKDAAQDEERALAFDVDGDGKRDHVVGTFWERWGRFYWWVKFSDGRVTQQSRDACKRVGVLAEKTNGHHDLVCDFDTRFRWNGENYVATTPP